MTPPPLMMALMVTPRRAAAASSCERDARARVTHQPPGKFEFEKHGLHHRWRFARQAHEFIDGNGREAEQRCHGVAGAVVGVCEGRG